MSTSPAFAAVVNNGAVLLGVLETSLTVPTTTGTLFTAGASGSKVEEIVVQATASTVLGLVYVFLYDGATYHLYDTLIIPLLTASTTVAPTRVNRLYANLLLKTGWSVRASQSIVGNNSILKAHASGGDY